MRFSFGMSCELSKAPTLRFERRTQLSYVGILCPMPDSNRHVHLRTRDFLTTSVFTASQLPCLWSGLCLHPLSRGRVGAVKSLHLPLSRLGSALPVKGSPNLTPFTLGITPQVLNLISPLCLPISPIGHFVRFYISCFLPRSRSGGRSTGDYLSLSSSTKTCFPSTVFSFKNGRFNASRIRLIASWISSVVSPYGATSSDQQSIDPFSL